MSEENRPPREELYSEETEKLARLLKNRGDQRIGQLLINAIEAEHDIKFEEPEDPDDYEAKVRDRKTATEDKLWSLEDDQLVEALENFCTDH